MTESSVPLSSSHFRIGFRFVRVLSLAIALGWFSTSVRAESPAGMPVGISKEKPAEGPSVKVAEGYMVPYSFKVPGTDVTVEMVPVPGGEFLMGSPEGEEGRNEDEGPQVKVVVEPMWVAKTEVTWALYKEYMKLYGIFKDFESQKIRPVDDNNKVDAITAPTELYDPSFTYEYGEEPLQPAVTMTQYAAQQFTKWISLVSGAQYRLPTEAEWEYAARGGTSTAYSWGNGTDSIEDYAWLFDNSDEGAGLVGTKKPNPFGLLDMHGNAAEWTVNSYTENGYEDFVSKQPIPATEMVKWPEGLAPSVVRGGSWWDEDAEALRSAARLPSDDEAWKEEDPNFPLSPWWFTSDPARGVGMRIFRSYKELPPEKITKFWEASSEDVLADVQLRIEGGRGGLGLVDKELPAAIEKLQN